MRVSRSEEGADGWIGPFTGEGLTRTDLEAEIFLWWVYRIRKFLTGSRTSVDAYSSEVSPGGIGEESTEVGASKGTVKKE